jgi:hypothetical protein
MSLTNGITQQSTQTSNRNFPAIQTGGMGGIYGNTTSSLLNSSTSLTSNLGGVGRPLNQPFVSNNSIGNGNTTYTPQIGNSTLNQAPRFGTTPIGTVGTVSTVGTGTTGYGFQSATTYNQLTLTFNNKMEDFKVTPNSENSYWLKQNDFGYISNVKIEEDATNALIYRMPDIFDEDDRQTKISNSITSLPCFSYFSTEELRYLKELKANGKTLDVNSRYAKFVQNGKQEILDRFNANEERITKMFKPKELDVFKASDPFKAFRPLTTTTPYQPYSISNNQITTNQNGIGNNNLLNGSNSSFKAPIPTGVTTQSMNTNNYGMGNLGIGNNNLTSNMVNSLNYQPQMSQGIGVQQPVVNNHMGYNTGYIQNNTGMQSNSQMSLTNQFQHTNLLQNNTQPQLALGSLGNNNMMMSQNPSYTVNNTQTTFQIPRPNSPSLNLSNNILGNKPLNYGLQNNQMLNYTQTSQPYTPSFTQPNLTGYGVNQMSGFTGYTGSGLSQQIIVNDFKPQTDMVKRNQEAAEHDRKEKEIRELISQTQNVKTVHSLLRDNPLNNPPRFKNRLLDHNPIDEILREANPQQRDNVTHTEVRQKNKSTRFDKLYRLPAKPQTETRIILKKEVPKKDLNPVAEKTPTTTDQSKQMAVLSQETEPADKLSSTLAIYLDIFQFPIISVIKSTEAKMSVDEIKRAMLLYIRDHKDIEIISLKIDISELNLMWWGDVTKLIQVNLRERESRDIKLQLVASEECKKRNERRITSLNSIDRMYPHFGNFKSTPHICTLKEKTEQQLKNLPELILENSYGRVTFKDIDVTYLDFSHLVLTHKQIFFIKHERYGVQNQRLYKSNPTVTFHIPKEDLENFNPEERTKKLRHMATFKLKVCVILIFRRSI